MHIIPVIDLLNGTIVHAKKGDRSNYQAITSGLTKSSKPLDIVKAFMDMHPFKTLYIADLNAIQNNENTKTPHTNTIQAIKEAFPHLNLWVDAGINTSAKAAMWSSIEVQLILGSESFQTLDQYQSITQQLNRKHTLSLDFSPQGYMGPVALLENIAFWPEEIIIMTLAKVGANSGVDLQTLQQIFNKTKKHAFYAAGGVRNLDDLQQLKQLGIKGALIATALHQQQISADELQMLAI